MCSSGVNKLFMEELNCYTVQEERFSVRLLWRLCTKKAREIVTMKCDDSMFLFSFHRRGAQEHASEISVNRLTDLFGERTMQTAQAFFGRTQET